MNTGLLGRDGVIGTAGHYQSPFVPLSRYVAAKKYTIPHPLGRRSAYAQPLLRCRLAEGGYAAGEMTSYIPTDTSTVNGAAIIHKNDQIDFVFPAVSFSLKNKSTLNTFVTTAANWDERRYRCRPCKPMARGSRANRPRASSTSSPKEPAGGRTALLPEQSESALYVVRSARGPG